MAPGRLLYFWREFEWLLNLNVCLSLPPASLCPLAFVPTEAVYCQTLAELSLDFVEKGKNVKKRHSFSKAIHLNIFLCVWTRVRAIRHVVQRAVQRWKLCVICYDSVVEAESYTHAR